MDSTTHKTDIMQQAISKQNKTDPDQENHLILLQPILKQNKYLSTEL